jgi:hypothetical protein
MIGGNVGLFGVVLKWILECYEFMAVPRLVRIWEEGMELKVWEQVCILVYGTMMAPAFWNVYFRRLWTAFIFR